MKAELIFKQKAKADGYIREMIIWRLNNPVVGCRHLFKYRLYFGRDDGECLVRYDNERGKGDHKHFREQTCPYLFQSVKALMIDFARDVSQVLDDEGVTK
jgi:hypothetical protein